MSRQRELGGLDPDKALIQMKAFKILNCEGREVLHYVFTLAWPKSSAQNLQDYLINVKGMKKGYYEKWFKIKQHKKILSDPLGIDFDITMLIGCLGLPLPGLAKLGHEDWTKRNENKLEYLITQIKDLRNDLAHEIEIRSRGKLITMADDVKNLLANTYRLAAAHYRREATEVENRISDMKIQIDDIVQASHIKNSEEWQRVMEDLRKQQTRHVQEATRDLQKKYLTTSKIHPASFLTHVQSLQIHTVYCKVGFGEEMHDKKN